MDEAALKLEIDTLRAEARDLKVKLGAVERALERSRKAVAQEFSLRCAAEDALAVALSTAEAVDRARAEGEAAGAARGLGVHDARNELWLSGGTLKQSNITSSAGKAALCRFVTLPRAEGLCVRDTPERIEALVNVINECHVIWNAWEERTISREEAESYVRGYRAPK